MVKLGRYTKMHLLRGRYNNVMIRRLASQNLQAVNPSTVRVPQHRTAERLSGFVSVSRQTMWRHLEHLVTVVQLVDTVHV